MNWMCVSSKFICWNPNLNEKLFEGVAFARELDHESGAFMNVISSLIKQYWRTLELFLSFSPERYKEKSAVCKSEGFLKNQTMLESWCQASSPQNCDKQISIVYKPPVLWYFVTVVLTKMGCLGVCWTQRQHSVKSKRAWGWRLDTFELEYYWLGHFQVILCDLGQGHLLSVTLRIKRILA